MTHRVVSSYFDDPGSTRGSAEGTSTEAPYRWQNDAACRGIDDPSIFWPKLGESLAPALAYCNRCTVADECLDDAMLTGDKVGVRGGLSALHRRKMRSARRRLLRVIRGGR